MFSILSMWKLSFLVYFVTVTRADWPNNNTEMLTNKKFNCSQPPKLNNFDISKCCRLPAINMSLVMEKCQKQIKSFESHNDQHPAHTHMCYPECIYRETNTLKADGDIHVENVQKFLTINVKHSDKIIVPTIVESFRICLTSIKQNMLAKGIKRFTKLTELGCSPYSSMVYGCVNAETFLHCPKEMWQQNESSCNLAKIFAQQCNPLPHVALPYNNMN